MYKILVVDDEEGILNLETRVFERTGFSVVTAKTAHDGLETFVKERPDVIFSDVRTGGPIGGIKDGIELAEKANKLNQSTLIYMTSGDMSEGQEQRLKKLRAEGAVKGFYWKPIEDIFGLARQIKADVEAYQASLPSATLPYNNERINP
ncbi:response regulator [Candidatus Woesearchaeota archaeon]|nr:response regulator [Candidatus Woesearchaeota archaeon]